MGSILSMPPEAVIPWYIYLAAAFGAIGYIFTNIASVEIQTFTTLQAAARFWAAFPIAAGVYFLSRFLLDESFQQELPLAGIVFLAGFSMEVFIQAFNILAHRILGLERPNTNTVSEKTMESNKKDED